MHLNKPIYAGLAVLDLSKICMYQFHYEVMVPTFGCGNGSIRDLGSIFQGAGEFDASRAFAPFHLDAPAALRCWPVPPLKAKYTEAALVQQPTF